VRGVLTAIFWIEPPPVTHRIFATVSEAKSWAGKLAVTKAEA
jgi:hypothetical protein